MQPLWLTISTTPEMSLKRATKRPKTPILNLSCCIYAPSVAAMVKDYDIREYVKNSVDEYQKETGDELIFYADPNEVTTLNWPEEGGNIEHWGRPAQRKWADAVSTITESLPSSAGEVHKWKRNSDACSIGTLPQSRS